MHIINLETDPVKEKHVCYYTRQDGNDLFLHEVVEAFYQHPDGPALIPKLEDRVIRENKVNGTRPDIFLLLAQQQQVRETEKRYN